MKREQMKRMIYVNATTLISIASSSIDVFYRIHSLLIEHDIELQSHKEAIKSFSFNEFSINIQTTFGKEHIINYPFIFCLIALLYNALEVICYFVKKWIFERKIEE